MTLRRNGLGQLGFHVNYEGIVAEVDYPSIHNSSKTRAFTWRVWLRLDPVLQR